MKTEKDYLDLIDETVNYYSEDVNKRAYEQSTGRCHYKDANGKMCAVGRCLINPPESSVIFHLGLHTGIKSLFSHGHINEDDFKEEYRGFNISFWCDLQDLHDTEHNWTPKGLSSFGVINVEQIKNTIPHYLENQLRYISTLN